MKVSLVALFLVATTASSVFAEKEKLVIQPIFSFDRAERDAKPQISRREAICLRESIADVLVTIGWSTTVEGTQVESFLDETEDKEEDFSRWVLKIGEWSMPEGAHNSDEALRSEDLGVDSRDEKDDDHKHRLLQSGLGNVCNEPILPSLWPFCPKTSVYRRNLKELSAVEHQFARNELIHSTKQSMEVRLAAVCNDMVRDCMDYGSVEDPAYPTCGVKVFKTKTDADGQED